jgi:hypothetical protein
MKNITIKDVLNQLKADLIGKDSYRGVTLTYSWLANQFGHFALGFIPTIILNKIFIKYTTIQHPSIKSAICIALAWLLFELYNFLGPLLLKKSSNTKYQFQPAWGNIAFDTFTDVCFFAFGAFTASLFLIYATKILIILIVLVLILAYPIKYWYTTKMYLQYANYPFQYRLSQFDGDINDEDKKTVQQFLGNKQNNQHLFVFGNKGSGKTSIAVAMGTELSIQHNACTYITGVKLYPMFYEEETVVQMHELWNWRKASFLLIDDINPGNPITNEIVTPQTFLSFVDAVNANNSNNRATLTNKNIIWVLGNDDFTNWQNMLLQMGVSTNNISSINLNALL